MRHRVTPSGGERNLILLNFLQPSVRSSVSYRLTFSP